MSNPDPSYERYQRQILLNGFGREGQEKLRSASVLVAGAGGLGCPALQYLVAAGTGRVGIVDDDVVSLHNLHRQVLFATADIGLHKAAVAAKRLCEMNPEVEIIPHTVRLTNQNAWDILADYTLVLDATDNFATRYVINDACVLLNKPLVYGAISQFEGQVAVFNANGEKKAVNYRDLFPQPPEPGSVLNCAEAGVLGVLPGIIGTLQATEAIKLITGLGNPLVDSILTYNALTCQSHVFQLTARESTDALLPKTRADFEQTDYDWLCGSRQPAVEEISAAEFDAFLQKGNALIIDVREEGEQPAVTEFRHEKRPLSTLPENMPHVEQDVVVLFCQSGKRSREAATRLSARFGATKKILSLNGGILQWKQQQHAEKA